MEPAKKPPRCPKVPVCTCFKDASGAVLYVGKAGSLRSRVRSYFLESRWMECQDGLAGSRDCRPGNIVVDTSAEGPLALENISSSAITRNSMFCCAMTRPIPTSSSPRRKISARLFHSGASRRMVPIFRPYFSRPAWRAAFCTSSQPLHGAEVHGGFDAQSSGPACSITLSVARTVLNDSHR